MKNQNTQKALDEALKETEEGRKAKITEIALQKSILKELLIGQKTIKNKLQKEYHEANTIYQQNAEAYKELDYIQNMIIFTQKKAEQKKTIKKTKSKSKQIEKRKKIITAYISSLSDDQLEKFIAKTENINKT